MKQTSVKSATHKGWHRVALLSALIFGSATASATELLNSSYDVSRELFTALNPGFQQQWEQQNPGDKLTIIQSHAGSSKQALA
ncbi:MAG: sulfate ABC transporter substrate-binding protein, partial [Yersinia sp. (in: enterobacteria)]